MPIVELPLRVAPRREPCRRPTHPPIRGRGHSGGVEVPVHLARKTLVEVSGLELPTSTLRRRIVATSQFSEQDFRASTSSRSRTTPAGCGSSDAPAEGVNPSDSGDSTDSRLATRTEPAIGVVFDVPVAEHHGVRVALQIRLDGADPA